MRYRLKQDVRVQAVLKGRHAPGNRESPRTKNFTLRVKRAADFPHRIVKLEDLQLDLLQRHLYGNMKPVNLFSGEFEVSEGFEEQFKEIAGEHGFVASEMILA